MSPPKKSANPILYEKLAERLDDVVHKLHYDENNGGQHVQDYCEIVRRYLRSLCNLNKQETQHRYNGLNSRGRLPYSRNFLIESEKELYGRTNGKY